MDPSEFQSPKDFVAGLSRTGTFSACDFLKLANEFFLLFQTDAKALLQKWREENGRNSELIREIWRCPKLALASNLGDESEYF